MTDTIIYHNPRCSKSRQTLELLKEKGIEPQILEYLKTPPNANTLRELLNKLGIKPRDLMRKKEKEYKELGLDNPELSDEELIQAMVEHPRLIERPIIVHGNKVALGRPPENVLEII